MLAHKDDERPDSSWGQTMADGTLKEDYRAIRLPDGIDEDAVAHDSDQTGLREICGAFDWYASDLSAEVILKLGRQQSSIASDVVELGMHPAVRNGASLDFFRFRVLGRVARRLRRSGEQERTSLFLPADDEVDKVLSLRGHIFLHAACEPHNER